MPSKVREESIEVKEAPTSIDPYATLFLTTEATQEQIKTAYRKAALKHHPDKAAPEDKDEAHTKFQEVAFAYAILSDERRKRRYDTTGRTEESLEGDDDFDWVDFFREQFAAVITSETINNFSKEYKGSGEEREHVLAAYQKYEGNMGRLYTHVMLSDVLEDDERFRGIIDAAIETGEVEGYKKYTHETDKSKKARITQAQKRKDEESKEAEKAVKDLEASGKVKASGKKESNGDMGDLAALIQQRQKDRGGNFLASLEEKYAPKSQKGRSKRAMEEPPEEAFARNAKKGKSRAR